MIKFVWSLVIIGFLLGGFVFVIETSFATSAPQQAAAAARGLAIVILPYCFARAVTEIMRDIKEKEVSGQVKGPGIEIKE
jgi:sugar phosphate permease